MCWKIHTQNKNGRIDLFWRKLATFDSICAHNIIKKRKGRTSSNIVDDSFSFQEDRMVHRPSLRSDIDK